VLLDGCKLKIASIGIKVRKWLAYHGIAIKIIADLSKFERIIACGLAGQQQGSLHSCGLEAGAAAAFDAALRGRFIVG